VVAPEADTRPASSPTVPGANSRSRGSGPRAHTSTLIPAPFTNPTRPPDQGRPPEVEGEAPASHSKVLLRGGAPSREAEGAPELAPVPEAETSRRVPRRVIATISCALAVAGVSLGVWSGALELAHLAPTVEDSAGIESPASRASEDIPGLGAHRLIPTAQRETSGPRLRKHAPGKRPL
jgi:hypothetical protein